MQTTEIFVRNKNVFWLTVNVYIYRERDVEYDILVIFDCDLALRK